MDPATAYFLKKYYPHVIKWWLVLYNPDAVRIWPSKAEEEEALRIEAEEAERLALEAPDPESSANDLLTPTSNYDMTGTDSAFNATTGSYSGLYGQKPLDAQTQETLNAIMSISRNQSNIDSLLFGDNLRHIPRTPPDEVILPPEQNDIIDEANAIYERLLREAAEDEAKKQLEIENAKKQYDNQLS